VNKKIRYLVIAIVIVFSLLYLRLMHLQIADYDKYHLHAVENASKTVREPAPRGVIYDRNGKVLVENRPVFSVEVLPYVLNRKSKEERERILKVLSGLLGEEINYKVSASEPLIVKDKVSLETAILIEERKRELDGVMVASRPVRLSRHGSVASHLLGYVGEIEAKELDLLRKEGYRLGDFIGKDGVEKIYDKLIRGKDGGKKVEVDVLGTPLRVLETLNPIPGADMKLTIDLDLQMVAEKALGAREGAVVILDARSGEILAMVSYPNYDLNIFNFPLTDEKWKAVKRLKYPFVNRALAVYPPGSIFKVITLAAALEEGKASPDEIINCNGSYELKNRLAKCWLKTGHGPITVKEGLVWSCDPVFYELGRRLGPELIAKYARGFGLGEYSEIDLPQERRGNVPNEKWKRKYFKQPWYVGDSINYGIGQGFVQVTPLQMALVYAAIASGNVYRPYVVSEIKEKNGKVLYKGEKKIEKKVPISAKNLQIIREALRDVVDRATGVAVRRSNVPAAGKTGTAENPGLAHAWFIGYAPIENPEIVISAFVAHGQHGDQVTAYIVRDILKWYKKYRLKKDFEIQPYEGQYILHYGKTKVPYGNSRMRTGQR
jgi:penicillin-binding protein 2